jgi:hypothetical protein
MPRRLRLRRRADHGTVFAHGRRRLVTQQEDIPPAEPADLMAGRVTTLWTAFAFVTEGR